ncbi:NUDIX domain-containing protein [Maribacter phage Molly_5]|uniref:NUDIX domain-containing protein n=1 Tax=Maribacter phage Molly_1 TaxID=2745685 RepID=A0A8E4UYD1_9CAUD|nr:MutT/NUDIX hydrolase [Maribacter phage Molly_1]QQO97705.1 NUDIX domain-containing protein [Maribacter phage Molly_2]QQO97905.1 NUDIX domain-containing protein [Maribacter phage Molly_3]QQO98105.1 NUDIX domain-containing protein [Maribacter phage Molly_4]QQO98305.1 NUDIX domain-containing protein [Maribacter phage Molly_5]QQO97505.1 NUDIX domain-containing protein [Maribacter phage Molly_1]
MDYKYKTAVGIVINDDNEILLGRCVTEDDRNGMLCFPGGGIDKGEDIFSAAIREVQEETNISCHVDKMVFVTHSSRPTVAFVMLKPEVGFMDPKFNDEYDQSNPGGWFPLDNLPTAEVLNNNLDILRNFKLVTGKVEYAKDNINESSNMKSEDIKSLIESSDSAEDIVEAITEAAKGINTAYIVVNKDETLVANGPKDTTKLKKGLLLDPFVIDSKVGADTSIKAWKLDSNEWKVKAVNYKFGLSQRY